MTVLMQTGTFPPFSYTDISILKYLQTYMTHVCYRKMCLGISIKRIVKQVHFHPLAVIMTWG